MIFYLSEKAAETQFWNLGNQCGCEKRKLKEANKNRPGAKDVNVRLSEIFPYLSCLESYFVERQTGTNFQPQTHLEDKQEEQQDGDDNISVASSDVYNNPGSLEMSLAVKQIFQKLPGEHLLQNKKESYLNYRNLNSKKDDGQLYGDLFATKLWRLSSSSKSRAMKLTMPCLNTCFRMRKINKRISKLLQEINLQVLRQPHRHPFRQAVLYIINRINNRRINNRQYRQDNFQIGTVFKHNKKAMWT